LVTAGACLVQKELAFYGNACSSSLYHLVNAGVMSAYLQAAVEAFSHHFSPIMMEQDNHSLMDGTAKEIRYAWYEMEVKIGGKLYAQDILLHQTNNLLE
jgi:hypothetical protein